MAAAAAACWYVLRRLERTRAELGTFRRLMVLLAVLPGLVLGAALSDAAGRTVTWASDHTAQANADKALLASYRLTPPRMPSVGPAAPAAFARRLLTTADVGSGWYDVQQVNPQHRCP